MLARGDKYAVAMHQVSQEQWLYFPNTDGRQKRPRVEIPARVKDPLVVA